MRGLGERQDYILHIAIWYEAAHGPYASVPITKLTEAFWNHDFDGWENLAAYKRSLLAHARRAVKALVARGLMEADGWAESHTGGGHNVAPGHYRPMGYTRECRSYCLTDAGRELAEQLDAHFGQLSPSRGATSRISGIGYMALLRNSARSMRSSTVSRRNAASAMLRTSEPIK